MLNIVRFIWRNNILFLFLILEALSFTLIFQWNNYHKAGFINSSNKVSGNLLMAISETKEYVNLKKENDSLANENSQLRSLAKQSYYIFNDSSFKVNDSLHQLQYYYTPAKVINNSIYKRSNYITLNKGSKSGIKPDMGVICANGVVGTVVNVSGDFSVVMSLLHEKYSLGVMFKKDNAIGSLLWDGINPKEAIITDIPDYVKVNIGDTIVTTSFSTLFPEGIMVGLVNKYIRKSGDEHSIAKINLSTHFGNLSYVYVIENFKKQEQLELEKKAKGKIK